MLLAVVTGYLALKWFQISAKLSELNPVALQTLSFAGAFILLSLEVVAQMTSVSDFYGFSVWTACVGTLVILAYSLFVARLFRMQSGLDRWEIAIIILFVLAFTLEVIFAVNRLKLAQSGTILYRDEIFPIPSSVLVLVVPFIIFRSLVLATSKARKLPLWHATILSLKSLLQPGLANETEPATARAFLYVSFLPVFLGVSAILRAAGVYDWTAHYAVVSILILLLILAHILAFINVTPLFFSFKVRVVGAAIVAVFMVFGGFAWISYGPISKAYGQSVWLIANSSLEFQPQTDGGYLIEEAHERDHPPNGEQVTAFSKPITLPFEFEFYGKKYKEIFLNPNGFVNFVRPLHYADIFYKFGSAPAIFVLSKSFSPMEDKSGVHFAAGSDDFWVMWKGMTDEPGRDRRFDFHLRLRSDGTIEQHFTTLPERYDSDQIVTHIKSDFSGISSGINQGHVTSFDFATQLPYHSAAGESVVKNWNLDYRTYLNEFYGPVALLLFISTGVVLFALPMFFSRTIERPLMTLVEGARSVTRGDLNVQISPVYADEIGFLAESFNEMTAAQKNLIEGLEVEVAMRTKEASQLAAENARIAERNYVHRELHDSVSQILFSANLLAADLPRLNMEQPEAAAGNVSRIKKLNQTALEEMRGLLGRLRTNVVADATLGANLKEMIDSLTPELEVELHLTIEQDTILPASVQHAFYRVGQEAINNAIKHARAQRIDVYFDGANDQALLSVRDDGRGFDVSVKRQKSYGLHIMRERVEEIGGVFEIETAPREGAKISVIWFKKGAPDID